MSLKMLEFLTYLCSGLACLVLGIVLIAVKTDYVGSGKEFSKVKNFIAYAAFLDVLADIVIVLMQCYKVDYLMADWVFIPVIFFTQLFMASVSMLTLMHSKELTRTNMKRLILPVLALAATHCLAFLVHSRGHVSIATYEAFLGTGFSNMLCGILYAVILAELLVLGFLLVRDIRRYGRLMDSFYSGQDVRAGKRLIVLVYAYFTYFVLAGANAVWHSVIPSITLLWTTTILFMFFSVQVINIEKLFVRFLPAFSDYGSEPSPTPVEAPTAEKPVVSEEKASHNTGYIPMSLGMEEKMRICDIISGWSADPGKPYLREGITLAVAAESMKLSPRLLSDYLNNILKMNFNTWINSLRIEEVKTILKSDPGVTLLEVAVRTGFADASALTKTFKKFTGKTPSQFRAEDCGWGG